MKTIPTTCNYLLIPQNRHDPIKHCSGRVVAIIHQAGYCQEHVERAEKMFGKAKPVERQEVLS
jgi:hypothetical protein